MNILEFTEKMYDDQLHELTLKYKNAKSRTYKNILKNRIQKLQDEKIKAITKLDE